MTTNTITEVDGTMGTVYSTIVVHNSHNAVQVDTYTHECKVRTSITHMWRFGGAYLPNKTQVYEYDTPTQEIEHHHQQQIKHITQQLT